MGGLLCVPTHKLFTPSNPPSPQATKKYRLQYAASITILRFMDADGKTLESGSLLRSVLSSGATVQAVASAAPGEVRTVQERFAEIWGSHAPATTPPPHARSGAALAETVSVRLANWTPSTVLDLSGLDLGAYADHAVVFHALRHASALQRLDLSRNRLTDQHMELLKMAMVGWPSVRSLRLRGNFLTAAGARLLLACPTPPLAQHTAFHRLEVGGGTIEAADTPLLTCLSSFQQQTLDLSFNDLSGLAPAPVEEFLQRTSSTLQELGLAHCSLPAATLAGEGVRQALVLRRLDVAGNSVDKNMAAVLSSGLEQLHLEQAPGAGEVLAGLGRRYRNALLRLTMLDLRGVASNELGTSLSNLLSARDCALRELNLGSSSVTSEVLRVLAGENNAARLEVLGLSGNPQLFADKASASASRQAGALLAAVLRRYKRLRVLALAGCQVGVCWVEGGLTLFLFNLCHNLFSPPSDKTGTGGAVGCARARAGGGGRGDSIGTAGHVAECYWRRCARHQAAAADAGVVQPAGAADTGPELQSACRQPPGGRQSPVDAAPRGGQSRLARAGAGLEGREGRGRRTSADDLGFVQ